MKYQRHKRKETFSILLISNTDRHSRQFQISLFSIRLVLFLLLFLCVAAGGLIYWLSITYKEQSSLRTRLTSQKELSQQLQTENEALRQTNEQLETALAQKETNTEENTEVTKEAPTAEPEKDNSFSSRYPTQGSSVLQSEYSAEHPCLTINTYTGCNIITAADGTVTAVGSDDTYKYIIEVQHANGYTTRYLCHQDAELKAAEGTQVRVGDILLSINNDNTQIDYQIIYNGNPIDPLTLIDAKG